MIQSMNSTKIPHADVLVILASQMHSRTEYVSRISGVSWSGQIASYQSGISVSPAYSIQVTNNASCNMQATGSPDEYARKKGISDNIKRLEEIAALQEDWNDHGAKSFSSYLINKMKKLILTLPIQPFISPTARQSIQFEYEDPIGNYLEFELFPDGTIKKFLYTINGESCTEYITDNKVSEIVESFYK